MTDIWILGAAGRSGRAIAADLARRQASVVLVGRDRAKLGAVAETVGGSARIVVAGSLEAITSELRGAGTVAVMNTIGPFVHTALPIIRACAAGSGYVDISNELAAVIDVLALADEAARSDRRLVAGAGYGVLATESIVLKLCEGRAPAARVRVDTAPFVDSGGGVIGPTLAATIVESFPAGGRRYEGGRLVRAGVGGERQALTAPDGTPVGTGLFPSGDLEAARRASGAPSAISASIMAPSAPLARALMPAASALFSWAPARSFATRRIGAIKIAPHQGPGKPSWSHARVNWADGDAREGWLRAGDAADFTAAAAAAVAFRVARGEGRPGAYTPGALYGPELAVEAGGAFVLS
jgi:short subunit dehydrogenase-like uncharacterized protein